MPVRRSARLRGLQQPVEDTPTSPAAGNNNNNKPNKSDSHRILDTVMERDEPRVANTPVKPPTPATIVRTPKATPILKKSPAKTPTSAVTRPTHQEMHPSKVQKSTTKQADSGLILGFNPIKKDAQGNVVKENIAHDTPTKARASPAVSSYGTPGFEFRFTCQESQLSDEAKKLMESVREDVARIKANLVHDKVTAASGEASQTADRKIALPKGRAGRFSDAHIAEFKKMDSIAGHASAFRAVPGRFQPVKSLKRTNSKARLDEPESRTSPARPSPQRSPAFALPSAKRAKHDIPNAAATGATTPKSAKPRLRNAIRSSLMTPTRASMARTSSTSLKPARTSMIPSLARSPVSQSMAAPRTPRTDFNPRLKSHIPTLGNLKSILRRPQPLFSKDPAKIAAGTHKAAPGFSSDLLFQRADSVSEKAAPTPSPKKRVEFTPIGKSHDVEVVVSPSPSKIPTASSFRFTSDIVYPTLPALTPDQSKSAVPQAEDFSTPTTIRHVRPSEATVEATLPEIPGVPHGISHKKRHRAAEDENDRENVPPPGPKSDERSAKRVRLNSPSPAKLPISSPLKPRSHTPVRSASGASRAGTPGSARPKSRGALSISRLNMLAQPKRRT